MLCEQFINYFGKKFDFAVMVLCNPVLYPHTQNATGESPWMNSADAREARDRYCHTRKGVGVYFVVFAKDRNFYYNS